MPKIVFHIGSPKTGTTSIQNFLRLNSDKFFPNATYPNIGRDHAGNLVGFRRSLLRGASEKDLAVREEFRKLFQTCLKSNTDIIISNEQLWTANPKRILDVYPILKKYDIYILVFLREQSSMIVSHYKEKIRAGNFLPSIEEFFVTYNFHYNYFKILNNWRDSLSTECVHTLIYEIEHNNLINSFISEVNLILCGEKLNTNEFTISEGKLNVGISDTLAIILSTINASGHTNDIKNCMRSFLLASSFDFDNSSYEKDMLKLASDNLINCIRDFYKQSNESLKVDYLKRNYDLFDVDLW